MPVLITALFTIARTQKPPRGPLTGEWIKNMWHVCPREYYSAVKNEGFASVIVRWRKLESVIQCEVTQKEKDKRGILTRKCGI